MINYYFFTKEDFDELSSYKTDVNDFNFENYVKIVFNKKKLGKYLLMNSSVNFDGKIDYISICYEK